jgi:uncharacterized protein (TIGR02453 family)
MSEGFTPDALKILAELAANNNRAWFAENRGRLETLLLAPAREAVTRVGALLQSKRPGLIADPRIDQSIYRLNRDTRFSRDKTPYKDHLGLIWWEGTEDRLESPCFYLHLTPAAWHWSVGCYRFNARRLLDWRAALLAPKPAAALRRICARMESEGAIFNEPELKRAPAGFDPARPMMEWLRRKGLYSWSAARDPLELCGGEAAEAVCARFLIGLKLHEWLLKNVFRG